MAVVKLILGSTTGGGTFSNKIVNSGNTLSNASIKTSEQNEFLNTTNMNKNGREMLSWGNNGILRFNSSGKLSNNGIDAGKLVSEAKPDMLVFGAVPSSKEYSVKLIFKGTKNVRGIAVYGDKVAKQFATEAILNGVKTIYSGEYKMEINFNSKSDEQIVEFIKWNRANYNASFSQISVLMNNYEVNRGNGLKNVESLSQSTAQNNQIHYGVIANSGNVEVLDPNGDIKKLVLDGTLPISNMPVQIICNGKQIQSHISVDSDYDNNAKALTIEFTNDLSNWQALQYKGYAYPKKSENAYVMLLDVLTSIGYKKEQVDEMLSTKIIYGVDNEIGTIQQYLEQIIIEYPYLPQASVRETIDKFCTLAQLQVFKTDDDKIKFVSARPVATDEEKQEVIFIDKSSIFGNFTRTILLKNKYNAVEINENFGQIEYNTGDVGYENSIYNSNYEFNDAKVQTGSMRRARIDAYYVTGNLFIPNSEDLGKIQYINLIDRISHTSNNKNRYYETTKDNLNLSEITNYIDNTNIPLNFDTMVSFSDYGSASPTIRQGVEYLNNKIYENIKGTIYTNDASQYVPTFLTNYDETTKTFSFTVKYANDNNSKLVVTHKDNSFINLTKIDNGYNLEYNVLSKLLLCGYFDPGTSSSLASFNYLVSEKESEKINISIYGTKGVLKFTDVNVSDDISHLETVVSLNSNELIQTNTTFKSNKISNVIKFNIKNDYEDGIPNATVSVACVDYYSNNMRKIKDWSKGETFEVGDVVKVEGDDNLWRVTGRNFKKSGVPVVELELQMTK